MVAAVGGLAFASASFATECPRRARTAFSRVLAASGGKEALLPPSGLSQRRGPGPLVARHRPNFPLMRNVAHRCDADASALRQCDQGFRRPGACPARCCREGALRGFRRSSVGRAVVQAEEHDTSDQRLVSKFPQAFSHVALVNTAHNIAYATTPCERGSGISPVVVAAEYKPHRCDPNYGTT
jgi:hypothetical protein